jgi:aspartate racemase
LKTVGLIGGMSWQSTIPYYRILNESIRDALGGFHSARVILYSVDFAEIEALQRDGRWDESAVQLTSVARALEGAGADVLVIGTNTMHIVADEIAANIGIPLLHVADATAAAVLESGARTVGLLGTRFTMEKSPRECRKLAEERTADSYRLRKPAEVVIGIGGDLSILAESIHVGG